MPFSIYSHPWPTLTESFSLRGMFKPIKEGSKTTKEPQEASVRQEGQGSPVYPLHFDPFFEAAKNFEPRASDSMPYSPLSPRNNIDRAALRWGEENEGALLKKPRVSPPLSPVVYKPKARHVKPHMFARGGPKLSLKAGGKQARFDRALKPSVTFVMPPLLILTAPASNGVPVPLSSREDKTSPSSASIKKKSKQGLPDGPRRGVMTRGASASRWKIDTTSEEDEEDLLCYEEMPSFLSKPRHKRK
jgi:hypothetical protein